MFNALDDDEARGRLLTCLDVPRWADEVLAASAVRRPRPARGRITEVAAGMSDDELEQALARHPRIGERADAAKHDASHSSREQSGVDREDVDVVRQLADGNRAYEERFGRVFIIRAAGRDAHEILDQLRAAAGQQRRGRAGRDDQPADPDRPAPQPGGAEPMTTLSTHVLDTSLGRPAVGVSVALARERGAARRGRHRRRRQGRRPRRVAGAGDLQPALRLRWLLRRARHRGLLPRGARDLHDLGRGPRARAAAAQPVRLLDLPRKLTSES